MASVVWSIIYIMHGIKNIFTSTIRSSQQEDFWKLTSSHGTLEVNAFLVPL